MRLLDCFNDDYGALSDPRYFQVTPEEYEKLTNEETDGGRIDPKQKEVTCTENGTNVIKPSGDFDGLSSVKVTVDVPQKTIKEDTVELSTTENGTVETSASEFGVDGLKSVKVTVDVPSPSIKQEPVSLTFNENRTYTISAEEYNVDGLSSVEVTVDVQGGDYSKWEIGDIVIYDNVEDKKIKSTRGDYNLDKFPLDRFTPIGVIAFVMEDGSARMLALAAMNTNTPDTGSDTNQSIYWGYNYLDITGLTNFTKVATIDPTTGEVVGAGNQSYVPSTGDQFGGKLSLDGVRVYYIDNGALLPSPYNENGTLNQEFTKSSVTIGPLYCWSRQRNGSTYYMYTDTETPSNETILWCASMGNNSQVKDYGNTSKIGGSYGALMLGSILDESVFDGGVEAFTENFTAVSDSTYEETCLLGNSDMNGKENCAVILANQTDYIYDKQQSGEDRYYWFRVNQSDGKKYFLFTNDDENNLTVDTKIYIQGQSSSSFVNDYGTVNQYNGTSWYEVGTIGDGTHITGGVEGFTTNFTRLSQAEWRTAVSLENNSNEGNYPIATSTWRFHTPGTEQGDWYCPAAGELATLISNFGEIQGSLKQTKKIAGSRVLVAYLSTHDYYWSSSEVSASNAWYCSSIGYLNSNGKSSNYYVRALCLVPALD